ncbi:MAG TPA: ABC transporter substrate-binding protein [Pseudonocardiaceae bacterium]|nr:ABC transporter substrate-binding protein [Pseudonocardiaceae bacterium]
MPEPVMVSRRRILQLGVGLAALGSLAAACSAPGAGSPGSPGSPKKGGSLRYARATGPTSLDPHATILAGDVYTLNQIFEPLYITAVDGSLQPHLATGHTVSADGKTYTFALRPNVTFSDGSPLTSADVVYSLNRAKTNKGPLGFLDGVISSVTASGASSVVVELTQAWSPFVSDISAFSNSIVPNNLQGKPAADFFAKPVGTGPFTLESWVKGGTVTLAANPKYWQRPGPYLDKVVFSVVEDANQLVQQLRAGQVDVIDDVPAANVSSLSGGGVSVLKSPQWSVDLLLLNAQSKPFTDPHVRRALAHAVNRAQIVKATTFGTAEVAGSFFPSSLQYYDGKTKVLDYDLAAARSELAQSGYPSGFSAQLLVPSSNQAWNQAAQIIQDSLKQIGIVVSINSIEDAAYKSAFEKFDFDMFIDVAINDISDPDEMASFELDEAGGGSNSFWTHYSDQATTDLVHQAQTAQDPTKRQALYSQIQQKVADNVPFVPLSYPTVLTGLGSGVQGFKVNPAGAVRLEEVWLA